MRSVTCPSCGQDVDVVSRFVKTVMCRTCGHRFSIQNDQLPPPVKPEELVYYPTRYFTIGKIGQLRTKLLKRLFTIVGRLRFADHDGFWDEWYLEFADGALGRLEEEEGVHTLFAVQPLPASVPQFEAVPVGSSLLINGQPFYVTERFQARVAGAQGRLPLPVRENEPLRFLEGIVGGQPAAIKQSEDGWEYSIGEVIEATALKLDEEMFEGA